MKKFILMLALMLSLVFNANAQTALESQKIMDNVYVGVAGGVTTPLDFNSVFPVNATAGLSLGKEFTPVFGVEVQDFVMFGQNHFMDGKTFVKCNNLLVNGKINLSNLLCDYLGHPRKFELATNTGIGWQHRYGTTPEDVDELIAKTGLDFMFNFNGKHSIVLSPAVFWNLTNREGDVVNFNKNHAQLGVSLGYVYHFPTSNGTHAFKMYDVGAMNDEINNLRAELAKKPREIKTVSVVEKQVMVPLQNIYWIPFAFDKAELSSEAQNVLNAIKDKETVNVDGYASWEDGSNAEHNKQLSIRRANAVASYLKSLGFNIGRCEGHGATNVTSQRCVIVTLVK